MDRYPIQSLFPSAENVSSAKSENDSQNKRKELDWLENQSFTADTAQKFVEFQEELKTLQNESESITKDQIQESHDNKQTQVSSVSNTTEKNDSKKTTKPVDINKKKEGIFQEASVYLKSKHKEKKRYTGSPDSDTKRQYQERSRDSLSDKLAQEHHKKHKHKKRHRSDSSEPESRERRRKRGQSSDSSSSKEHRHHHKKKKSKKKKKQKEEKHSTEGKVQDLDKSDKVNDKKIFLEDFDKDSTAPTYKIDKNKDPNSYIYGSLYKLHIPNYRSYYKGCIGGKTWMSESSVANKKKAGFDNRYFGKENSRVMKQVAEESLSDAVRRGKQSLDDSDKSTVPESYIDIGSKEDEKKFEDVDVRQKILDSATSLYVKGVGVGEVKMEEEEKPRNPLLVKIEEFNRELRLHPDNVKLWLDFVKFQDSISVEGGLAENSKDTGIDLKRSTRSSIEKKISILDKAIESNPGNIELLLARLELYREILDSSKVSKELEQLLFIHPANIELWKHFIAFNQSKSSNFTVSKVTKVYHKCLKVLTSVMEGIMQTHSVPENLEEEITAIVLQYCYFLRQTGHREKCVATLQAIVEYSLFCPVELKSADRQTRVAALERFWESGCPRIGTKGAKGWRESSSENINVSSTNEETLEDLEQAVIEAEHDKYVTWLKIETLRESHHWFPWRPDLGQDQTEDDCEDVERLVLFEDVSPVLFTVPTVLWNDFMLCVLDLLQIKPIHQNKLKSNKLAEYSNEVSGTGSSVNKCYLNEEIDDSVIDFAVNFLTAVGAEIQGHQQVILTLASIEIQLQKYKRKNSLSKSDKKDMRKIVKNVLKEELYRNNLFVWVRYIDLESMIGKPGEAVSVAETALAMYSGLSMQDNTDSVTGLVLLCATYCNIALDIPTKISDQCKKDVSANENHWHLQPFYTDLKIWPASLWEKASPVSVKTKQKVMYALSCLIEGRKFKLDDACDLSTVSILKTSSKFSKCIDSVCEELKGCDHSQVQLLQTKFLNCCWCYSVFLYCAKDLQAAVEAFKPVLTVIQTSEYRDRWRELGQKLYYTQLGLILYHMSRSSVTLSYLRTYLNQALKMYPDHPEFVWLYIEVERKCRVSGRLNRFIDSHIHSQDSPVTVALAVCAELQRLRELTIPDSTGSGYDELGVSSSALVNRTRSWLERCLNKPALQHCPLLWRLYLQLESDVGNTTRLKGIFYRAIQQCPWNKSLHMDGICYLGTSKLQEIVDLMVEKELRVQIPVEELDILVNP